MSAAEPIREGGDGTRLDAFVSWLIEGRGNAPSTAKNYAAAIRDFYARMDLESPERVNQATFDRYAHRLYNAKLGKDTRRARLVALRVYFRWLFTRGHLPADLSTLIELPQGAESRPIPTLSPNEIRRLADYKPPPPIRKPRTPKRFFDRQVKLWALTSARDPCLLTLAYSLALRGSEPGKLEWTDLQTKGKNTYLTLRQTKNAKHPRRFRLDNARVVPYLHAYAQTLEDYGIHHPAIFPPLARNRHEETGRGLSRDSFALVLKRRVEAAGIDPHGRRISPHILRYSRATHMAKQHLIPEIQALLGHRSAATTEGYIKRGSLEAISGKANRSLPWNTHDYEDR